MSNSRFVYTFKFTLFSCVYVFMKVFCIYGALEKLWFANAVKNINKTIKANSECSSHSAHSCDLRQHYSSPFFFSTCSQTQVFTFGLIKQYEACLKLKRVDYWPSYKLKLSELTGPDLSVSQKEGKKDIKSESDTTGRSDPPHNWFHLKRPFLVILIQYW